MSTLRELQAAFREAVLGDGDGDGALALEALIAGDGLPPRARLMIYRHHVLDTLTGALRSTYPVACRLVDERFFGYAADRYIRANPPAGPCLFEYGASFPDFLREFPPCRALRYLADVARLEWALHAAVHAPGAVPLSPVALRDLPIDGMLRTTFRLDPSVTLLESQWPVDRIWRAMQPDADPTAVVDVSTGGVRLEVRRRGDDAVVRALDPAEYALRRSLAQGMPLEAAATAALAEEPGFVLVQSLRALFEDDVLVGFTLHSTEEQP